MDDARLSRASDEPQNWLMHGGNWAEQRYSTLAQINTGNVSQLKPATRRAASSSGASTWCPEIEGLRTERGMIGWPKLIDGDQAELIRAYVGERARELKE